DAHEVRMQDVAQVISSGLDAPTTLLSQSSQSFRDHFQAADLIISKGQGNLEGLIDLKDPRIYFLLMAKCRVMAERLGVEVNDFVIYNAATNHVKSSC
ncbi:MAG: ARMT1-like domain-containing protein, partial [Bacteroidales bacterium]|nr:ARMT1-like domain-containing protein [Bacteroidales bacterium]